MNLAARATLSVPLIALVIASYLALIELLTHSSNSVFSQSDSMRLVFTYSALLALPTGFVMAIPAVVFGDRLPRPALLYLAVIGTIVGGGLSLWVAGQLEAQSFLSLTSVGALAALLWWLFVERHRTETDHND